MILTMMIMEYTTGSKLAAVMILLDLAALLISHRSRKILLKVLLINTSNSKKTNRYKNQNNSSISQTHRNHNNSKNSNNK